MKLSLYPRSLFGRLTLLLVSLLTAAQLLSATFHFYDHKRIMLQTAGINSADRIAGIARLLDTLPQSQRTDAVRALDVPPLRVALGDAPLQDNHEPDQALTLRTLLEERLGDGFDIRTTVSQSSGSGIHGPGMMGPPPWARGMGQHMGWRSGPGQSLAAYQVHVRLHDGQGVQFRYRLPQDLFSWRWRLVASLAVLLVSAVFIALLAVRTLTRPLQVLARAADGLGRDIEHPPLPETGPSEVVTAARAFNQMQQRLSRFIADRARVLAAMSHDLKTPITRLRLRAAMLDDESLQARMQSDLDDMEAMVTSSLEFLRGMESNERAQPLNVMGLLEGIQDDLQEMGHQVELRGPSDLSYRARPLALKRCLVNLVQNAVRYGTIARVSLETDDRYLWVNVDDDGPGIAPEHLEQVFEPFFRLEQSRNRSTGGNGLGLAIARNIARSHGGDVTLTNRSEGGLRAQLRLPR